MPKTSLFLLISLLSCAPAYNSLKKDTRDPMLTPAATLQWVNAHVDSVLVKHVYEATNGLKIPYRLFSPQNDNKKDLPLVIYLHGRGDRGTDNDRRVFANVGLFMNELSLVAPNMQAKYPCYVLVPQCSDKTVNEEWAKWEGNTPETPFKGLGKDGSYTMTMLPSESGAATLALIDHMLADYPVDRKRVYLTGLSMGGFGTWEFTARRPELFAAAVPMAGFSDPTQIEKIKNIPFWIFHGDADKSNPVEGSRNMYQVLKKAGAEVKYTEYAGASHGDSFRLAFAETALIPWMFSQKKN